MSKRRAWHGLCGTGEFLMKAARAVRASNIATAAGFFCELLTQPYKVPMIKRKNILFPAIGPVRLGLCAERFLKPRHAFKPRA